MVLTGAATLPGSRYGALNQDFVLIEALFPDCPRRICHIAVVLDGHGMLGEAAARDAGEAILASLKDVLRQATLEELGIASEIECVFNAAFLEGHEAALRPYDEAPTHYTYHEHRVGERRYTLGTLCGQRVYKHPLSGVRLLEFGTTASVVVVQGQSLVVAHVGDSLVALGRECSDGGYEGVMLTEPHSGADGSERERLRQECGDKVKFRADHYLCLPHMPGVGGTFSLAMTRALGHKVMQDYGVIPLPSIHIRQLDACDVCIVAASDGVWDAMSASQAVNEVCEAMSEGRDVDSAAHALCHSSIALFKSLGPADNTTAALLIFDQLTESSGAE